MKVMTAAIMAAVLALMPAFAVYGLETSVKLEGIKGVVKDVTPFYGADEKPVEGSNFITIERGENDVVVFLSNEDTKIPEGAVIAVGAEIEAFYDANLPVIMIYPPRYNAISINVISEAETGAPAETPAEAPAAVPEEAPAAEQGESSDPSSLNITVLGEELEGVRGFVSDDVFMVPIRAIAEKLGYDVGWEAELKQVTVGNAIRLTIGLDEYILARMAPISLGAAPVIKDGVCYVPISFFGNVIKDYQGVGADTSITEITKTE